MNDTPDLTDKDPAAAARLLKASGIAFVVAVLVLTVAVLPAEYGVDPTGMGARLGLITMSDPGEVDTVEANIEESSPVESLSVLDALWKRESAFRNDEMSLTLEPGQGAEIKAMMNAGDRMMFSWESEGGGLTFDMHGEALNAGKDEFTSYWKGRNEDAAHGAFIAPFAGTHGWYWRNRGTTPVSVRVQTSGYYEKLFKP
jgi:hypothetical protein